MTRARPIVLLTMLAAAIGFRVLPLHANTDLICHAGAYRNEQGVTLVLTPPPDEGLRYILMDGRSGLLRTVSLGVMTAGPGWRESSPEVARAQIGACGSEQIQFRLSDGPSGLWKKIALKRRDVVFQSGEVKLAGRLLVPPGLERWPLAVLVHGSEATSARDHLSLQYLLPASGIAVFVYDKRGTGGSSGKYTQNFTVLAQDAEAAVREARRLAGSQAVSVGLFGASQGGWVAPRAAVTTDVDFVVIAYGLVATPLEEDAWQVSYDLTRMGFSPQDLARAREVTDATAEVVASGFARGIESLMQLRSRYGQERWFAHVVGEYSGELLKAPQADLPGPVRSEINKYEVPWQYDAIGILQQLKARQVWILACEDAEAPSIHTFERLAPLRDSGSPIDVVLFPGTDHGIAEFTETPDGKRTRTRFAPGYFETLLDAVRGKLKDRYARGARFSGKSSQAAGWFHEVCRTGAP